MAIKQIGQKWNPILDTTEKKYIIDSAEDVTSLPKCCPGSCAIAVDGGTLYMVNASGEWTDTGVVAFSLAEEGIF